ncbi:MAG: sigma factor-like helix-turn-helix DNA-binding protein [Minicystis sp.]
MIRERRSTDRARPLRREILCADPDRIPHARIVHDDARANDARDALDGAVRDAVSRALTDKQRQVVEAYFFEGLSQGEIARRLGVTQQVVQKRIFGAPRGGKLVGGAIHRLREVLSPLVKGA